MEYQNELNPDGTKKDAKTGKSGSSSESQEGDWEEKAEANPAFMIQKVLEDRIAHTNLCLTLLALR